MQPSDKHQETTNKTVSAGESEQEHSLDTSVFGTNTLENVRIVDFLTSVKAGGTRMHRMWQAQNRDLEGEGVNGIEHLSKLALLCTALEDLINPSVVMRRSQLRRLDAMIENLAQDTAEDDLLEEGDCSRAVLDLAVYINSCTGQ